MNNPSINKRVTLQELKRSKDDAGVQVGIKRNTKAEKKVENTRAKEEGMRREQEKDREGEKIMLRVGNVKENVEEKAGECAFNVE